MKSKSLRLFGYVRGAAALLGALASILVLVILALMDNTVHDDEYVIRTYDYPILAKVPNLTATGGKKYAYVSTNEKGVNSRA